jgi:hypothetical protein
MLAPFLQIVAFKSKRDVADTSRSVARNAALGELTDFAIENDDDARTAPKGDAAFREIGRDFESHYARVELLRRRQVVGVKARFEDALGSHGTVRLWPGVFCR